MRMAKLVIIKNPFRPYEGREVHEFGAGCTAAEVLARFAPAGMNAGIMVNGAHAEPSRQIAVDDFVVVYPKVMGGGGRKILGTIAMIALSVYSGGIAGGAWAKAGSFFAKGALGAVLASAAVMFVGGTLINRVFGQRVDNGRFGDGLREPTYSWDGVTTMSGQNNPIALTYGTVQSGGQSIAKFVDVRDNQEYLNWLVAAGEGPLIISNIQLNDNDVSYYKNLTVETREGTNTQEVIPNFNDTYSTKTLGYQLLEEERIDIVPGNAAEGILVKVEFSNGLYYANDDGSLGAAWVDVLGQYRLGDTGDWKTMLGGLTTDVDAVRILDGRTPPEGTYTLTNSKEGYSITYPDGHVETGAGSVGDFGVDHLTERLTFHVAIEGYRIKGQQSSALRKEFRLDPLSAGAYQVRLKVTGRSHDMNSTRAMVRCWWSSVTSIVHDDFRYPNIALIGIKALATDQLSGTPALKFLKTRPYVLVWNPTTETYERAPSDNPAWAAYDVLHQCTRLQDANTGAWVYEVRGIPAKYMIYDQFKAWADYCTAKNLKVNIELNTLGEMLSVINTNIAAIGRGKVIRFGTRYGCVYDHVQQPSQMFGMGNIIAGSFHEEFLQTSDRANCVELTYTDAANNYNRETITIYADSYDTDAEEKTAQATFNGITSYAQAYREGMYQLYSNQYLVRTISFEANVDAIACTVGDVVLIAHDVPRWAKSGRIHEVDGDELLLPVELTEVEGDFRIQYRTVNDAMYTTPVEILANKDGWCRVRLAEMNAEDPPHEGDIFDLARAEVGSKPFVVKGISRAQDFTRKIECIEYDARVYGENYDIPAPQYATADRKIKNAAGLNAARYQYMGDDGSIHYRLDVSWERQSIGTYQVYTSSDNINWNAVIGGLDAAQYSCEVDASVAYVKVVTVNNLLRSNGISVAIGSLASMIKSLEVTHLTVNIEGHVVTAAWADVAAANLQYYQLTLGSKSTRTLNPFYTFDNVPAGTYTLKVAAVNAVGTAGVAAAATVTVSAGGEDT